MAFIGLLIYAVIIYRREKKGTLNRGAYSGTPNANNMEFGYVQNTGVHDMEGYGQQQKYPPPGAAPQSYPAYA